MKKTIVITAYGDDPSRLEAELKRASEMAISLQKLATGDSVLLGSSRLAPSRAGFEFSVCDAPMEIARFIPASELLEEEWRGWFWSAVSESSPPFSWGDNNRSLVSAERFLAHLESIKFSDAMVGLADYDDTDRLPKPESWEKFLERLRGLHDIYIDLEN